MTDLERSLIATIAWFDMSDYPLTAWEAWKWRISLPNGSNRSRPVITIGDKSRLVATDVTYLDVLQTLQKLVDKGILRSKWSFFFLPVREPIVEIRRKRYLLARDKFKRARWVVRILRRIPWVRMISVCNSLGYANAALASDIDLFIITAPRRVWTVRAMALAFLRLFHLRPLLMRFGARKDEKQDRIDLTFFVDETALDLSSLMLREEFPISNFQFPNKSQIQNSNDQKVFDTVPDPYLSYWIVQQTPLSDRGGCYKKFWDANARLRAPLPRAGPYITNSLREVRGDNYIRYLLQALFFWMPEQWWESIELALMPARLKQGLGGTGVVLSNHVLKFHDIDPRRKLRERWITLMNGFGL